METGTTISLSISQCSPQLWNNLWRTGARSVRTWVRNLAKNLRYDHGPIFEDLCFCCCDVGLESVVTMHQHESRKGCCTVIQNTWSSLPMFFCGILAKSFLLNPASEAVVPWETSGVWHREVFDLTWFEYREHLDSISTCQGSVIEFFDLLELVVCFRVDVCVWCVNLVCLVFLSWGWWRGWQQGNSDDSGSSSQTGDGSEQH